MLRQLWFKYSSNNGLFSTSDLVTILKKQQKMIIITTKKTPPPPKKPPKKQNPTTQISFNIDLSDRHFIKLYPNFAKNKTYIVYFLVSSSSTLQSQSSNRGDAIPNF